MPVPTEPNAIAWFDTDADGNDMSGIRLPAVAAPRATFTGWNRYADPFPASVLCDREDSQLPFARTRTEWESAGDPRPSLEERYADPDAYVAAVTKSVDAVVSDRLLLRKDGATRSHYLTATSLAALPSAAA